MAAAPAQTLNQLLTSARACRDPAATVSVHTPLHMTFQTHACELGSREIKSKLEEKLGTPSSTRHASCWINPSHLRSNPTTTITIVHFDTCPCLMACFSTSGFVPALLAGLGFNRVAAFYRSLDGTPRSPNCTEDHSPPFSNKETRVLSDLNVVERLGGVLFASS